MSASPTPVPPLNPYGAPVWPAEELTRRREAIRAEMRRRDLDTLLVVGPENIYYLTGLNFQGYFALTALVLGLEADPHLFARQMESATVAALAPDCIHVPFADEDDPAVVLARHLAETTSPTARIGVELDAMFFPPRVLDELRETASGRGWIDASGLVMDVRAVKSPAELEYTRRAAGITDRGVLAGMAAASSDTTEREVAAAVYAQLVRAGSEHPGFAPLIRGTDILSQEHVTWRNRPLATDAALLMELSASVYRYHAPQTRMVFVAEPDTGTQRAAQIAVTALEAARRALVPGALTGEVYDAWQHVVDEGLGHHQYRRHHCGYMVGIGFPPSWVGGGTVQGIRRGGTLELREGMVFHLLSWLLGQQPGDYCVSDTVLVTADGGQFLTHAPRQPRIG